MRKAREAKEMQHCETTCEHCAQRLSNPICSIDDLLIDFNQIKVTLKFSAGETLFQMGDTPKGFYSVRSGVVKMESYARSGAAHTLRFYGPGTAFAYRSIFSGEVATASAIALEPTEVCLLPREPVLALTKKNPEALLKLVEELAEDLKIAEKKWMNQVDLGAAERVAEALIFFHDRFNRIKWTRREIAQWAGTTPETVIRTLAQFEKEGVIDQAQGRHIVVKNRERLLSYIN